MDTEIITIAWVFPIVTIKSVYGTATVRRMMCVFMIQSLQIHRKGRLS
jgi:hypothetical protein